MPPKPPAFQFYAVDFLQGTKLMTLSERGAYITLLACQWDDGCVPGDNERAIGVLLGCGVKEVRKVWPEVSKKFTRGDDGGWRNARLEQVRSDRIAFSEKQSHNARLRFAKPSDLGGDLALPSHVAWECSPSSSPSSKEQLRVVGTSQTLVQKRKPWCHYEGERIEVPQKWHDDHVRKLGGPDAASRLEDWYRELDAGLVRSQMPIVNWFKWLDKCYAGWAEEHASMAEYEAHRPKGA